MLPHPTSRRSLAAFALAALALASGAIACQPELPEPGEPLTSREWVQASARVHDPAGLWSQFAAEATVASVTEAGRLAFQEDLYIDRGADTFRRSIATREALLTQTVGPSGCTARWPGARNVGPDDLLRNGLEGEPCDVIVPRRELHEFLIGLPMSVLGAATRFGESPAVDEIFGRTAMRVQLSFADDPGGQIWQLYIDPDSKQFIGASFTDRRGGGERFAYENYVAFEGFRLAQRRTVTKAVSEEFVIEQRVRYTRIEP